LCEGAARLLRFFQQAPSSRPKGGNSGCAHDKIGFCPSDGEYFILSGICPVDLEGVPFLLHGYHIKKPHLQRVINGKPSSNKMTFIIHVEAFS
jgi:hypothetical protein